MNDQSNSQNGLSRVLEKIQEIVEKSADADYIYRGEPDCYPKVSSNLYREYEKEIEDEHFNVEIVQKEILDEARKFSEHTDDFEILVPCQSFFDG